MSFEASEEPVFSIGTDTDVMELNPNSRELGLMIHVSCWEHELQSDSVKAKVRSSVNKAINYLIAEGYMTNVVNWKVSISVIGHAPTQNN